MGRVVENLAENTLAVDSFVCRRAPGLAARNERYARPRRQEGASLVEKSHDLTYKIKIRVSNSCCEVTGWLLMESGHFELEAGGIFYDTVWGNPVQAKLKNYI